MDANNSQTSGSGVYPGHMMQPMQMQYGLAMPTAPPSPPSCTDRIIDCCVWFFCLECLKPSYNGPVYMMKTVEDEYRHCTPSTQ